MKIQKGSGASSAYIVDTPLLYIYEICSFSNLSVTSPTSQLILQPFRRLTYVTTHSPTLPSPYLRHNSFTNPSVGSSTSQFILQPFFRFSYVTSSSLISLSKPPMEGGGLWFLELDGSSTRTWPMTDLTESGRDLMNFRVP